MLWPSSVSAFSPRHSLFGIAFCASWAAKIPKGKSSATHRRRPASAEIVRKKEGPSPAQAWLGRFLEIQESRNLQIWHPKNQQKYRFSKSKSILPKMSARSGLIGKHPPGPISCHFKPFFYAPPPAPKKTKKIHNICLFPLVGHWAR